MKMRSCVFTLCLFLLISGCGQIQGTFAPEVTPTVHVQGEVFTLTAEDNLTLAATIYRAEGDLAVVFTHMGIADQTSWQDFAGDTASQGITALTFDFHCFGLSECSQGLSAELNLADTLVAIRYLRDQGYERIACVGACMGGSACLNASMQEDLAGMVFVAGPRELIPNGKLYPDDIVNPAMPKLFIIAEQDPYTSVTSATQRYYRDSPEPKQLISYFEAAHATDLFKTPSGSQFHQALMDFLLAIK